MRRAGITLVFLLLIFPAGQTTAGESTNPLNFHLSFEDFVFLDECVVARSGFKTIEDRGLTLEEGKFGKGLRMNKPPVVNEQDDMTGTDLDTVTAVVYNTRNRRDIWVGYNEPFLWGAAKLNPAAGSVAFWVKGTIAEGMLFNQSAMAWGRKERFLLAVTVDRNNRIGAYIRDSQYIDHTIHSDAAWDSDAWNHVVLNWDRCRGLELFINGKSVASSWGTDSWWETPLAGLFHLPMPKVVYDELYLFARPLAPVEVQSLMTTNTIPDASNPWPERTLEDRERLAQALGLSAGLDIPAAAPMDEMAVLSFKEITPEFMGDGHVPAWFCQDGRYELAWPHPIAVFTIVPGDVDFLAEKLDIDTPPGVPYNYVTIEGNLRGMPAVLTDGKKEGNHFIGDTFITVPQDGRFFYGTTVSCGPHPRITLPFLKGYGAPGEFSGNVRLPLTGETRIHEVGLFDVTVKPDEHVPGESVYYVQRNGSLVHRYDFALRALNPLIDRTTLHGYMTPPEGEGEWLPTGYLTRIHLITALMTGQKQVDRIVIDIGVKTKQPDDVLLVRLHDPGVPHRIWTHAEVKLTGFDGQEGGRLRLMLDPPPLFLMEDDVIWLDIATLDGASIKIGGPETARIVLKPALYHESLQAYEQKALMPTLAEYMKGYHHQPWLFERTWPDIMNPRSLGGQFDSVMPAMAVLRVLPHSRRAQFYVDWAGPKYHWGSFVDPEKNFPIKDFEVHNGVPRWAYLQHVIQNFRFRIIDWLAAHQNPDGQIHGGWNDDTLILRGKPDIPLDSCNRALDLYLRVYEGLDRTNIFGDGFCQIKPIDNFHNGDFVRERFRAVIYKPGDPYIYRRSLQTAWHWDKPDNTPFNWGGGKPFLFDKNILEWYWGKNIPSDPWKTYDEKRLDNNLSRLVSYIDDNLLYRFTEARIHTDSQSIFNEQYVTRMILGGNADASISVSWPEGGGEDLARWVTYADSVRFVCRMFSFDPLPRKVAARLYRIEPGTYELRVAMDDSSAQGGELHAESVRLRRFDTVTVTVPSMTPVLLSLRRIQRGKEFGPLPDLALAPYDCERTGGTLRVRVSNLGAAPSKKTDLTVYDGTGKKIAETTVPAIDAPTDFVEKSVWIDVKGIPASGALRVAVDPQNRVMEIFEGNNEAVIE